MTNLISSIKEGSLFKSKSGKTYRAIRKDYMDGITLVCALLVRKDGQIGTKVHYFDNQGIQEVLS
jgi:hypothetical protein